MIITEYSYEHTVRKRVGKILYYLVVLYVYVKSIIDYKFY